MYTADNSRIPIPPQWKDVIARLPRTFGPAIKEKLQAWELLFPAERRVLNAQLNRLSGLSTADFKQLFASVNDIESRMDLPKWRHDAATLSIEDTAIIARSPLYPQWRAEVEKVFARIDEGAEQEQRLRPFPRLIVCMLPAGLGADNPWSGFPIEGRSRTLDRPFREFLPSLVAALAQRPLRSPMERVESTWILESGDELWKLAKTDSAVGLSWTKLEPLRRIFLDRLNTIRKTLQSADETTEELKKLNIRPYVDAPLASDPRLLEFTRSLLLSGNGSLVFSNSFIQWGAAEAFRRSQPQVLLASFGLRTKPKPFSSVVLFEDQAKSNPVVDQPDLSGSLVDDLKLSEYVHMSAERLAAYHGKTVTLFAVADSNRFLTVEPKATVLPDTHSAQSMDKIISALLEWLGGDV